MYTLSDFKNPSSCSSDNAYPCILFNIFITSGIEESSFWGIKTLLTFPITLISPSRIKPKCSFFILIQFLSIKTINS